MKPVILSTERRLVFSTMGTVASLSTDSDLPETTRAALTELFGEFEQRFSLFLPETEASRVHRGELAPDQASEEFQSAFRVASDWQGRTRGAFDPRSPGGGINLTGVVKALAIQRGGALLDAHHLPGWCLNVGGDVLVAGTDPAGRPWTAGIVDPLHRDALISQFTLAWPRRAIATSGTSERGEHVWRSNRDFSQVSVVADDIVTADVLATALLAGGWPTLEETLVAEDVEVLAVTADAELHATPGFAGDQQDAPEQLPIERVWPPAWGPTPAAKHAPGVRLPEACL